MNHAIYLSNYGKAISARALAELARTAEDSGWDGFFLWDHILAGRTTRNPMVDPWVALAAMATATERIKLGTMVTPLPRRRPWKLARETVTLDHLSGGRLILGVGLGTPPQPEFEAFGEESDVRIRGRKLDEGLEILTALWKGGKFSYEGEHYRLDEMYFRPASLQQPRIPIWVAGYWPNKAPFRRAARFDGVFPLTHHGGMTPSVILKIRAFIAEQRGEERPLEVVVQGMTPGEDPAAGAEKVDAFAEAGLTWWLESLFPLRDNYEALKKRITQGPPRG
ncbi:MAG TPA: TIGR03619 family F420-dependent LLM class oxidoreductase [Anaerolineales bacterium]|nr:TIGR03619 family F420-dependent LLM class oxidoreductase [Anaerolineales bacterium]